MASIEQYGFRVVTEETSARRTGRVLVEVDYAGDRRFVTTRDSRASALEAVRAHAYTRRSRGQSPATAYYVDGEEVA